MSERKNLDQKAFLIEAEKTIQTYIEALQSRFMPYDEDAFVQIIDLLEGQFRILKNKDSLDQLLELKELISGALGLYEFYRANYLHLEILTYFGRLQQAKNLEDEYLYSLISQYNLSQESLEAKKGIFLPVSYLESFSKNDIRDMKDRMEASLLVRKKDKDLVFFTLDDYRLRLISLCRMLGEKNSFIQAIEYGQLIHEDKQALTLRKEIEDLKDQTEKANDLDYFGPGLDLYILALAGTYQVYGRPSPEGNKILSKIIKLLRTIDEKKYALLIIDIEKHLVQASRDTGEELSDLGADNQFSLAMDLLKFDDQEEATKVFTELLPILKYKYGMGDQRVEETFSELLQVLENREDSESKDQYLQVAYDQYFSYEDYYGRDHAKTLKATLDLAWALEKSGIKKNLDQALSLYKEALLGYRKIAGEDADQVIQKLEEDIQSVEEKLASM